MNGQTDYATIARRCSVDLGSEVTPDEVRAYLLGGVFLERLNEDDRSDMRATILKELDAPPSLRGGID